MADAESTLTVTHIQPIGCPNLKNGSLRGSGEEANGEAEQFAVRLSCAA